MNAKPTIPPNEFQCLKYDVSDHIALITLNRPERRNALNPRAYAEIEAAFRAASAIPRCAASWSPAPIPRSAPARTSRR